MAKVNPEILTETPATAVLADAGVPYAIHSYCADPEQTSSGVAAATLLGIDPRRIFKTIITACGEGYVAGVGPVGTYVFDEVDAGISGAVADMVGRKLREVSRHHQVLCVTHLPQVAALADSHFLVTKRRRGKRTVTEMVRLDDAGRVEELTRMLSGSKVTDRARAAAAELLDAR